MMLNFFKPLITLSFWFSLYPVSFSPVFNAILLYGNIAVILIGVIWLFSVPRLALEKDLRKSVRTFCSLLIWFGVVGLMLYAFTWLNIPILSMRFFWIVWLVGYAWWAWHIWKRVFVIRPKQKQEAAVREAYEKWLPKPKHKK